MMAQRPAWFIHLASVRILNSQRSESRDDDDGFPLQRAALDIKGFHQIHGLDLPRKSGIERLPVRVFPVPQSCKGLLPGSCLRALTKGTLPDQFVGTFSLQFPPRGRP